MRASYHVEADARLVPIPTPWLFIPYLWFLQTPRNTSLYTYILLTYESTASIHLVTACTLSTGRHCIRAPRAHTGAPAAPAIETPAPNMASPPAPPVESIDDDGTVASLGGTTGAGLMSQFEAALGDENAAPATGSEPKPPTEGIAPVDAALAPVP